MRAGIALAPRTAAEAAFAFLEDADDVVVLAVEPGWAGQPFQPGAVAKIEALRSEIDRRGLDVEVHVDGGVNLETVARCVQAGADVLVAATAIFGAADPVRSARELKASAEATV
jgi:ribulose-phosphate 3-epimerase